MPFKAKKIGGKWRVVKAETGKIEHHDTKRGKETGKPVDGGGYATRREAMAQAAAMNISLVKRGRIKPKRRSK